MSQALCPCGSVDKAVRHGLCRACRKKGAQAPETLVEHDRKAARDRTEQLAVRAKYDASLRLLEQKDRELSQFRLLREQVSSYVIKPSVSNGTTEATPVLVASDWHYEERVGSEVGGLNTYNLDIAKQRSTRFFQAAHNLITNHLAPGVHIKTVVLALLGDFISNDIHDEVAEVAEVPPTLAIARVQEALISGIEFMLANTGYNYVLVCHSGNHGRTTKTTRFATENGHSLEYLMYLHLQAYFRNEKRITFIIPDGMHSYVDIHGHVVRFHHGHAVKYGGGVGGIYIPVNKAIAQWNKGRHADLDVFGHFHQLRDGGNFIANGSLIGFNAFALSIKADYEVPKQAMFLIDNRRGRTCLWPIFVS